MYTFTTFDFNYRKYMSLLLSLGQKEVGNKDFKKKNSSIKLYGLILMTSTF